MNFLYLSMFLMLVGCNAPISEWKSSAKSMKDVAGLEDCTYISIDKGASVISVIRCPNSSVGTTQTSGKTLVNTSVIEDVEKH